MAWTLAECAERCRLVVSCYRRHRCSPCMLPCSCKIKAWLQTVASSDSQLEPSHAMLMSHLVNAWTIVTGILYQPQTLERFLRLWQSKNMRSIKAEMTKCRRYIAHSPRFPRRPAFLLYLTLRIQGYGHGFVQWSYRYQRHKNSTARGSAVGLHIYLPRFGTGERRPVFTSETGYYWVGLH